MDPLGTPGGVEAVVRPRPPYAPFGAYILGAGGNDIHILQDSMSYYTDDKS